METQKCESPPGFDSSWERLPDEEWLPVEWSNGSYWVSNYSRVWSAPRTVCRGASGALMRVGGTMLTWNTYMPSGRPRVFLRRKGKTVTFYPYRIAMEAFVGRPPDPDSYYCRHLDDNPLNCHISNLAWGTSKQNNQDMYDNEGATFYFVEKCKYGHVRGGNNVKSGDRGTRRKGCLACQRAKGYLRRYKPYSDTYFQEVSDRYYEAIQKEREL